MRISGTRFAPQFDGMPIILSIEQTESQRDRYPLAFNIAVKFACRRFGPSILADLASREARAQHTARFFGLRCYGASQ